MKFNCNFCSKPLSMRQYGAEKLNCPCGAVYRKVKTIEVVLEKEPKK